MWNQIVITFLIFVIIVDGVEETSAKEKTVDEFIDDLIHRNPVMVFSKTYCRYSKRAKRLLFEKYNIHPKHVLELDEREDMNEIQVNDRLCSPELISIYRIICLNSAESTQFRRFS